MNPRAKAVRRRRPRSGRGSGHIRHNRAVWDRVSAGYDRRHAKSLSGRSAEAWGVFRIPESTLRLLGAVRGVATLELGCGASRWSIALARRGARAVGIDLSARQLARARNLRAKAHLRFPLLRGSAERLPFRDRSFDLVFCDWGAMTFADPGRTVPECARVLRRGGAFVFATANPFRYMAHDFSRDRMTRRLTRPYFGNERIDFGPGDTVEFRRTYAGWVALFRANGFAIERLIEPRPRLAQRTTYLSPSEVRWARSWPVETIWKLVRE